MDNVLIHTQVLRYMYTPRIVASGGHAAYVL